MISKILALEALIGTIRAHLSVPVRNVSDITPEQHSHEIINAIELLSDKDKQLAEARAEIKKLHGILSTIRAADFDVEELRGHQCYAKQWACALRDRLKRLEAEK